MRTRATEVPGAGARGLTLVELVLAMGLLALLMVAVFQLIDSTLSVWRRGDTRRALLEQASAVGDLLARDLRGLEPGSRGDLLIEWVRFDTDGDGIDESAWPRLRLVRQACAADVERLRAKLQPAAYASAAAAASAPPRAVPELAEVLWMVAPASRTDPDARAEGRIWRGERLAGDASTRSFFAPGFFGASNLPPAGATEELSGGLLWLGLLCAAQTSVVHDGWQAGSQPHEAATCWDAWNRGRPDAQSHEFNQPFPAMPAARERALLPRRVRVELEFERPVDRLRRTRLLEPLGTEETQILVDDPRRLPDEDGAHLRLGPEWVRIVARSGPRLTLRRAQRGTEARTHPAGTMVHWGARLTVEASVATYREDWDL